MSNLSEDELLKIINESILFLENSKLEIKELNNHILNIETEVIGAKLNLVNAKEQLRRLQNRTIKYDLSERELEIERFKSILPKLIQELDS